MRCWPCLDASTPPLSYVITMRMQPLRHNNVTCQAHGAHSCFVAVLTQKEFAGALAQLNMCSSMLPDGAAPPVEQQQQLPAAPLPALPGAAADQIMAVGLG